ncbi:PREDICTED: CUB and zona pellucida-like domain-containing protein 1 isoform X2 [Acropora digitifera]|nr:PREDICTED: CUB and zona pellucida-like domain-containing protein 1 isoform X2 [Acropora digitifera]
MKYFPFIVLAFTSQLTVTPTLADSCKNPTVLKREGSFQSPNYPNHYPNGAICQWIIEIPHDIIAQKPFITLEFKNFNVEMDSRCNYDKVLVYDGFWESNNTLMGSFCGHITSSPIYATSGKMLVKFISDKSVTATGFNATFEFTSLLVPPLIVDMTASHFVLKGRKTELRCSASGLPTPNVLWTRLGVELIEGRRFAVLSLNNVTKADQGIYRCTANNSQGQKSATMNLTVVACPDYCVCSSVSRESQVRCRRANLTYIPSGTLRGFARLDLSENYIENITASDFRSFWNLYAL